MPSRTSPSPSPPPSMSVEINQQPGVRVQALRKIYTSALESTLKTNSYENFASCFPTPATYCPTALQGVHKQLNSRLTEECLKDFEKILDERNTSQGLNEWDAILDAARQRRDRSVEGEQPDDQPAHTLSADQLAAAFMHKHLTTATTELTKKLQDTQQSNQEMVQRVQQQREEIVRLVSGLEGLVKDVENATVLLQGQDAQNLREEMWDIEQELQQTRASVAPVSKSSSIS